MSGERSSLTELDDDRCDLLRWKGMYIEAEWGPTVPHSATAPSGATRPSNA
jgi:hypothetical protein